MKCFFEWIENEPLEKWALIADTNGSRHGIMTINLVEVYNLVLKACRSLPLVAIVECILWGTVDSPGASFNRNVKSSISVLHQNDRDNRQNKCQGDTSLSRIHRQLGFCF